MGVWLRAVLGAVLCVACGSSERADDDGGDGGTNGGSEGGSAGTRAGAAASSAGDLGAGRGGAAGSAGSSAGAANAGNAANGSGGGGALPAACPRETTNHVQGSRIRGRYAVTADGVRAWKGWHDTELDVDCEFFPAEDGTTRCMPNNYSFSEVYFLDENCTQAVYTRGWQRQCERMDFVFLYKDGDCEDPGRYLYYELGSAVTAPPQVYALAGEECVARDAPDTELFERGAELPPSRFVEGTWRELTSSGRIRSYGISASDGLRQVKSFRDSELVADTNLGLATDGRKYFLPGDAQPANYSDATCGFRLAKALGSCSTEPPRFARLPPSAQCTYGAYEVLAVGEAFTGQPYAKSGESCAPIPLEGPLYTTLPLPLTTFQRVEPLIDESAAGRLKPRYATTPDGGCWFDGFWDSELEHECAFDIAEDGVVRCLATDTLEVNARFTDAECGESLDFSLVRDCPGLEDPKFATNYAPDVCSGAGFRVWELGEIVSSAALPPLWGESGSTCSSQPLEPGDYRRATPIAPTRFVAAEIRVE